jgi:hypothetical protein
VFAWELSVFASEQSAFASEQSALAWELSVFASEQSAFVSEQSALAWEQSPFRPLLRSFVRELSACRVMPDPKAGEHYPYRVTPCSFSMTLYPFVGRISEESRVDREFVRRRGSSRMTVDEGLERPSEHREGSRAFVVTPDERREHHL